MIVDQTSFNAMTRTLSRLPSRRDALRGFAGARPGLGTLRLSVPVEAKTKKKKTKGTNSR
jgi:hypothetical protein